MKLSLLLWSLSYQLLIGREHWFLWRWQPVILEKASHRCLTNLQSPCPAIWIAKRSIFPLFSPFLSHNHLSTTKERVCHNFTSSSASTPVFISRLPKWREIVPLIGAELNMSGLHLKWLLLVLVFLFFRYDQKMQVAIWNLLLNFPHVLALAKIFFTLAAGPDCTLSCGNSILLVWAYFGTEDRETFLFSSLLEKRACSSQPSECLDEERKTGMVP